MRRLINLGGCQQAFKHQSSSCEHTQPSMMRVLVLSSGGKDSSLALWWAICQGWEVCATVTVRVQRDDSWMFQVHATEIATLQAQASGTSHNIIEVDGSQEEEVAELQLGLAPLIGDMSVDGLVSGALRSEYQRRRIDMLCERLGIRSFSPLWHQDAEAHMQGLIDCGMEMKMVSVSCEGLGQDWLGRSIDAESFDQLKRLPRKFRFNLDGEGGEYETVVIAGPHMQGRIEMETEVHWTGQRGHLQIESMQLVEPTS